MSQEKVDRYKEYKANKEKILKKEKMIKRVELGAAVLVAAAFLGWIGFSIYQEKADPANGPASVTEMDATAYDEYLSSLSE